MAQTFQIARFEEEPVLGIIRGVTLQSLEGVMEAAINGGLKYLEITLNTDNALDLIKTAVRGYGDSICLGAGTVLSKQNADDACKAEAQFIVGPTLNEEVAAFCKDRNLPYFPGAFTPTEIEKAWNSGAAMVKVFPASRLGPDYFKEVKGPFANIKLLAVGGVSPANAGDYLAAGASALAVGGSVFSASRMESGNFSLIRKDIEDFLFAVRSFCTNIEV